MNKDKKKKYIDDGHTVYNMDGVSTSFWKRKKSDDKVGLTGKERRTAIKAAFATYAPIFLGVLASFTIAILVIFLWLK